MTTWSHYFNPNPRFTKNKNKSKKKKKKKRLNKKASVQTSYVWQWAGLWYLVAVSIFIAFRARITSESVSQFSFWTKVIK